MQHFHGTPISGSRDVAVAALTDAHVFVSFYRPDQLSIAKSHARSFSVDTGAFSLWRKNQKLGITDKCFDWSKYYSWVERLTRFKNFGWAIIPDIIDGTEQDNDFLLLDFPIALQPYGVPVWHMHESLDRFYRLCYSYDRVAIGSSGAYSAVGTSSWWHRMHAAMSAVSTAGDLPCSLHGLRMLNQSVVDVIPLSSADSTTLAINIAYDKKSSIECRLQRAFALRRHIESITAVDRYVSVPIQQALF